MALNAKQKLFVKHYLVNKNATQAAKAAGYSAHTAKSMGAENLTKPPIRDAIDRELYKTHEKLEITAERILARIAEFAFDKKHIRESDALKACELLGKNQKLFTDNVQHSTQNNEPLVVVMLPHKKKPDDDEPSKS